MSYTEENFKQDSLLFITEFAKGNKSQEEFRNFENIVRETESTKDYAKFKKFLNNQGLPTIDFSILPQHLIEKYVNSYKILVRFYPKTMKEINKVVIQYNEKIRGAKTLEEFKNILKIDEIKMDCYSKEELKDNTDADLPTLFAGFYNLCWVALLTEIIINHSKARRRVGTSMQIWICFYKFFPKKRNIHPIQG